MNWWIYPLSIQDHKKRDDQTLCDSWGENTVPPTVLPKKIYSDQTSGSSNQFSGNEEYREHMNGIMSKQAAQSRLQEIQEVKCPEFFKK